VECPWRGGPGLSLASVIAPSITVDADANCPIWDDLGFEWNNGRNDIKPFPIRRWAHAAIDTLGPVVDAHGIAFEDVAGIELRSFAQVAALNPPCRLPLWRQDFTILPVPYRTINTRLSGRCARVCTTPRRRFDSCSP